MSNPDIKSNIPFPDQRPEISIIPSKEPVFELDWRELGWWFAIPEIGDRTLWTIYSPPKWELTSYVNMKTLIPAQIHGIDGVEIDLIDLTLEDQGWIRTPRTFIARLTESSVEYLATIWFDKGKRWFYTMLDENFDVDWYGHPRYLSHTGRFRMQANGSYKQIAQDLRPEQEYEVMGIYEVTIGSRSFTCARVLQVPLDFNEGCIVMEGYVTREGRTILCRRYNGRMWKRKPGSEKPPWDEQFPDHNRIIIDGVTFVHWYDNLTDRACGIDAYSQEEPVLNL